MKHFGLILFLLPILLIQCGSSPQKNEEAGGPCSYETKRLPVKVIYVFKTEKDADALMVIQQTEKWTNKDTLLFSAEMGHNITPQEADKLGLEEGAVYTYEIKDILSGSCTDHLERFLPEKYRN